MTRISSRSPFSILQESRKDVYRTGPMYTPKNLRGHMYLRKITGLKRFFDIGTGQKDPKTTRQNNELLLGNKDQWLKKKSEIQKLITRDEKRRYWLKTQSTLFLFIHSLEVPRVSVYEKKRLFYTRTRRSDPSSHRMNLVFDERNCGGYSPLSRSVLRCFERMRKNPTEKELCCMRTKKG